MDPTVEPTITITISVEYTDIPTKNVSNLSCHIGNNCPHYRAISRALGRKDVWVTRNNLHIGARVHPTGSLEGSDGHVRLPDVASLSINTWDHYNVMLPITYEITVPESWVKNG